mgnify:CR=1 FL=1
MPHGQWGDRPGVLAHALLRPEGRFRPRRTPAAVIGAIAKKAMSGKTLTNIPKLNKTLEAALASITVDSKTNPYTLAQMVFAFRDATSDNGISGSVYWTNPGYNVSGVGSSVLLDDAKNLELFRELASGSHKPGAWARWPTSDRRMMRQAACLVVAGWRVPPAGHDTPKCG